MKRIPLLLILLIPLLGGCIDESYQLENLDTEVRVLKNLELPVGNTKEVSMEDLLSQDPSILKPGQDGRYSILVETSVDSLDLNLDGLSFEEAELRMVVTQTSPLDFQIAVQVYDEEGRPLDGSQNPVRIQSDREPMIPAGSLASPSSAKIVARITLGEHPSISGFHVTLQGVTGPGHEGETLDKAQGFRIHDISLFIPSGIRL